MRLPCADHAARPLRLCEKSARGRQDDQQQLPVFRTSQTPEVRSEHLTVSGRCLPLWDFGTYLIRKVVRTAISKFRRTNVGTL